MLGSDHDQCPAGRLLLRSSSWLSVNGITSSVLECRITVPDFTVLADPNRFQAGHSRTSGVSSAFMFIAMAPPGWTDHDIRMMLIELGLGNADGGVEIVVGQSRIENLVAVVLEIGRLDAARRRLPAVEE